MAVSTAVTLNAHGTNASQQNHGALPDVLILTCCGQLFTHDSVSGTQGLQVLAINLADNADAQAGAGERLTCHDLLGNAELTTDSANLVLEQGAQRLNQFEGQVVGKATHVVVALNVCGAVAAAGLDNVRVQGALNQELDVCALFASLGNQLALCLFEGADELAADSLTLCLGLGDALECGEETLRLVNGDDLNAHGCCVVLLDLFALAFTEQTVVDEEAGELVSDSLVHECSCHGGVNAAGERADDAVATDLLADLCDLLLNNVVGGPGGLQACHIVEEVLQGDLAVVGVLHLGVPLHAAELTGLVHECCHGCAGGRCQHLEAFGGFGHGVTVRHPHVLGGGGAGQEGGVLSADHSVGCAVFAQTGLGDGAAEGLGHDLEAVADTEDRHASFKQGLVTLGGAIGVDRGGATGEHDGCRVLGEHLLSAHGVGDDFGVDAGLTHATSNELCVLCTVIYHQDGTLFELVQVHRVGHENYLNVLVLIRALARGYIYFTLSLYAADGT